MLALLAFTTALFVGPEVAAPTPKTTAPVVSNVAASTAIGSDFLVAFAASYSVDVQKISGTTGKPSRDRATTLRAHGSAPVSVAIASNGRNAMVAWALADYEVWVALVDRDGNPQVVRRVENHNAVHVAVAPLGDRYLLVIQASDAAGLLLDATTSAQIGGEVFYYPRTTEVSAASNGVTALVTFIGDRIVTFLATRDAAKAGPIFTGLATNLHIAWDGLEFAVAWNRPQHVVLAKITAAGAVLRDAADFADTTESVAAVAGGSVVLSNRTVAVRGAIVPLPVDAAGSVVSVAPNGATNLAVLATPQLAAAVTNFVDRSTAVPVAFTATQSAPSISAGMTQFFVGWTESDRNVVARFANDSFSGGATLPRGQVAVAAVDDAALAVTLDATTLTTHAIAADGTLLRSTRIAQDAYDGEHLTALQRNGDLFGVLLTPRPDFLVLSERAVIAGAALEGFEAFGSDLTAFGDHWVAAYYRGSGDIRFDELNFLGYTMATRATLRDPFFPQSMSIAADARGDLFVALPFDGDVRMSVIDTAGKEHSVATAYEATRAHVAWSGSEFVVVTEGPGVRAWLFDRHGNLAANPVTITSPLPPRDLRLTAGPAGIAIAYVRADAAFGDGDRLFVRQLGTYTVHGRPAR